MTKCRWNKYCFCNYMILCSRPTIAWTTSTVRARALSKRWSSTLHHHHPWRRCAPAPATTACTNSWETASRSWTRASGTTRTSSPPAETMSRLSWSTFCYTQISCRAGLLIISGKKLEVVSVAAATPIIDMSMSGGNIIIVCLSNNKRRRSIY